MREYSTSVILLTPILEIESNTCGPDRLGTTSVSRSAKKLQINEAVE